MSEQLALPVEVPLAELQRKKSLGLAIAMCMELAGFDLASLRKRESDVERENRMLREEVQALRRVVQGGRA